MKGRLKTLAAAASLSGWQWVFSIMYAVGGPLLQSKLHMSASSIALVFAVVGPLCSVFTQPLVGSISDTTGKRRVFIVVGSVGTCLGMLAVALCDLVSPLSLSVATAICGLVLVNLFSSILQPVARAVVLDGSPSDLHARANSLINACMMVSAVVAPGVGVALFQTGDLYRWLFVSGAAWILVSSGVTLMVSVDQPRRSPSTSSVLPQMLQALKGTPGSTWMIVLSYFFTWCAFSPFLVFDNIWFPQNVFHGVVNGTQVEQHAYQQGVRMGLINSCTFSAVSLLYSLLIPKLVAVFGHRLPWMLSTLISAACYSLFAVDSVSTVTGGLLINAGIALNFATANSIPFSLLNKNTATLVGIMNASTQVALLVMNPIASALLANVTSDVGVPIAALGASFALLSLPFIFKLRQQPEYQELQE